MFTIIFAIMALFVFAVTLLFQGFRLAFYRLIGLTVFGLFLDLVFLLIFARIFVV